ncbi:MAG: stimulus-sensing domain-containing protein [Pseudomonadota bacterium]
MAWGIAIKKSDAKKAPRADVRQAVLGQANGRLARSILRSRIARLILASNLAGLLVLIVGALVLNEMRAGLVQARTESLRSEGELIASVMADLATRGDPRPELIGANARTVLKRLRLPPYTRARLIDTERDTIGDSFLLTDRIQEQDLPPIRSPNILERGLMSVSTSASRLIEPLAPRRAGAIIEARSMEEEIALALEGEIAASQRFGERGERLISVSVPVRRVSAVVGALTLESGDIDAIIRAERAALTPFVGVAVLMALLTSALLTIGIARPLRRLSIAADRVRTGAAERFDLPALTNRKDEIGDLAAALEGMTAALSDRVEANERFAADVAHELKNPLTSIRSAVETSEAVKDPAVRDRMRAVIAKDVVRLDRLITDISNASRLEAEIAREKRTRVDIGRLLEDIVSIYRDTRKEGQPEISLELDPGMGGLDVMGREGPLGQVVRNLIENARSFSPEGGEVRITARGPEPENPSLRITIEDDGPGVPEDKLETIFDRFYSDRPEGASFGNNSGLGLSIVQQIVETHRGAVFAENRRVEGRVLGARFVVELPPARGERKEPS